MAKPIVANEGSFNKQIRSKIDLAIHKKEFRMAQDRALLALTNEIDDVIWHAGRNQNGEYTLNFTDLDSSDAEKIVAAFINYDDRDLFSIYENDNRNEIVDSLLTMLKKDTRETDEDFVKSLKSNLVTYYSKRAQELIDERCPEVENNERWKHDRYPRYISTPYYI